MRADITALSGGVAYARTLNVYASLADFNAALRIGSWVPFAGVISKEAGEIVKKLKKSIEVFGPYYVEGTLLMVGALNEQGVIPFWNSDKPFDPSAFKPDLNLAEKKQSGEPAYYQKTRHGIRRIPPEHVKEVTIIVRGRKQTRYRDQRSKKFVAKREGEYEVAVEEQSHSLTAWTLNPGPQGWGHGIPLAQVAKVSVGGGKISEFSSESLASAWGFGADPQYNTWLSPVDASGLWLGWEKKLPELRLPRSGIKSIDAWLLGAEERYGRYRDLALSASGELTH